MEGDHPRREKSSSPKRLKKDDQSDLSQPGRSSLTGASGTSNEQSSNSNSLDDVSSARVTLPCGNDETTNVGCAVGKDRLQLGIPGQAKEAAVDRFAPMSFRGRLALISATGRRTMAGSSAAEKVKEGQKGLRAVGVPDSSFKNRVQQLLNLRSYNHTSRDPNYPGWPDAATATNVATSTKPKSGKQPLDEEDKRCRCLKSGCLKLYCDCFGSGYYCAEVCTCEGCYNTTAYEDTVEEAKRNIESRNPFALAPKVVSEVSTVTPDNDEVMASNYNGTSRILPSIRSKAPVLGRHVAGCNCKTSNCAKKYCQCFQTSVGCSYMCRCEGCRNPYGSEDGK